MKPISEFVNRVICGDCLKVMKGISDNSVDLVVADSPYGYGYFGEINLHLIKMWLVEIRRLMKKISSIYWFSGWRYYPETIQIMEEIGYFIHIGRAPIVWDGITNSGCRRNPKFWTYSSNTEPIIFAMKEKNDGFIFHLDSVRIRCKRADKRNNPFGKNPGNLWTFIKIRGNAEEKVGHPTQKPLKLIERIIKASSNNDNIVLDPFLGSGTTAVACKQLGRKYTGIEINPEYCKIAEERLRNTDPLFHQGEM